MKQEYLDTNRNGWDTLVNSNHPYSNTSLPEFGPFTPNENVLHLLGDVDGRTVLDIGCGAGKSLEYMTSLGAREVWGLDISKEQIANISPNIYQKEHFFISPMEENPGLPQNYFDYVISVYSLGFSSDPVMTINLVSKYLKKNGVFIISWIHPLFDRLDVVNSEVKFSRPYYDESKRTLYKGEDKIKMYQYNLKISTLVNALISAGMEIDMILEEEPTKVNGIGNYKSTYFDERKLAVSPTTIIIKAHKK